ncbi:hypothetical protein lerEdw1_017345 [Lerista edwardsae]|nr:hypothetical protein lerEdw1_017345 [Lerista edwardsae]
MLFPRTWHNTLKTCNRRPFLFLAGTAEDKMRLFLIYYISSIQLPSEADLEQYKKALTDAGCNLNPLNYIKQWK